MAKKQPPAPADDTVGLEARDYVMARLGGALGSLAAATEAVVGALTLFVNPGEDHRGKERKELLEAALEAAGAATRGIEDCDGMIGEADMDAGEPWDEDEDED